METPDKWVILKITHDDYMIYRVFASWYGGYLGSDSWRLNSGIKEIEIPLEDTYIDFIGYSGSRYRCREGCYGTNRYSQNILNHMIETAKQNNVTVEILSENTKWYDLINI